MKKEYKQLNIVFPKLKNAFSDKDFIVSSINNNAVNWINRWPTWPNGVCIIIGEAGSGKTHLANIWKKRAKAVSIDKNYLTVQKYLDLKEKRHLLIENIEIFFKLNKKSERDILNIINIQCELGYSILITSRLTPKKWEIYSQDLLSRINSMYSVKIKNLDDYFMENYLISLFRRKQIEVPSKIIKNMIPYLPKDFNYLKKLVDWLDQKTLEEKRKVSLPLIKVFLSNSNIIE